MANLHEAGISNIRKIAGYILSILPSAMIIFSGIMKLTGSQMVRESLGKTGVAEYMTFLGALEIILVVLYWIPKTSNLGFFLLASYAGGIIVSELAATGSPIPGIVISTLLYVGTFLRKPSLSGLGI